MQTASLKKFTMAAAVAGALLFTGHAESFAAPVAPASPSLGSFAGSGESGATVIRHRGRRHRWRRRSRGRRHGWHFYNGWWYPSIWWTGPIIVDPWVGGGRAYRRHVRICRRRYGNRYRRSTNRYWSRGRWRTCVTRFYP